MKKINRKLIKGTNWALAGLLTLMGFAGCNDDNDDDFPAPEYGTPHASYVVKGRVTDKNGNALQNIRVIVPNVDHCQRRTDRFIPSRPVITEETRDTIYTKSNGEFVYKYGGFPTDTVRIHMKFEDLSIVPPRFKSDSTSVSFLLKDLKDGDHHWYGGEAEKNVQIQLKNK